MSRRTPRRLQPAAESIGAGRTVARHAAAAIAVAALAAIAFVGILRHPFLNWDDGTAIATNPHLVAPGVIHWAFTTTLLDHYQPLSWLVWAAAARIGGMGPWVFHAVSLSGHVLNCVLLYFAGVKLAGAFTRDSRLQSGAAAIAASIFAIHPVQVETVAWASAVPYVFAQLFLLVSLLVYLEYVRTLARWRQRALLAVSCGCYLLSLLSRQYAVGFPVVLLCIDVWVLRRSQNFRRVLLEKAPFAVVSLGGIWLEWQARAPASLSELGLDQRIELAIVTPFRYLGRLLVPVWLSPVYPLPVAAGVAPPELGLLLAAAVMAGGALVYFRRIRPLLWGATTFLLLLAPTLLAPSGVQASADRYLYIACVPWCLLIGLSAITAGHRRLPAIVVVGTFVAACAVLAMRQVSFWSDSVTLWTRAVAVDDRNDIATYNLASALADRGQVDAAMVWYERTLSLVPDHAQARENLKDLEVARHAANASSLATAGRLSSAVAQYTLALELDPAQPHLRASRGVALARLGTWDEAVADLSSALAAGVTDAEAANSLAFALSHLGRDAEAVEVLKNALRVSPDNVSVAHNLAQLLLSSSDASVRDLSLAQTLALDVCRRTGNQDPRALETLALVYAAGGNRERAREAAERGLAVARSGGDSEATAALEQLLRGLAR